MFMQPRTEWRCSLDVNRGSSICAQFMSSAFDPKPKKVVCNLTKEACDAKRRARRERKTYQIRKCYKDINECLNKGLKRNEQATGMDQPVKEPQQTPKSNVSALSSGRNKFRNMFRRILEVF